MGEIILSNICYCGSVIISGMTFLILPNSHFHFQAKCHYCLLPLGSTYETQYGIEDINTISWLYHLLISVCFLKLMCHYINLVIS